MYDIRSVRQGLCEGCYARWAAVARTAVKWPARAMARPAGVADYGSAALAMRGSTISIDDTRVEAERATADVEGGTPPCATAPAGSKTARGRGGLVGLGWFSASAHRRGGDRQC